MITSTVDGRQAGFIDSIKARLFESGDSAVILDYALAGPVFRSHKEERSVVDWFGFFTRQGATHWQAQGECARLGGQIDGTSQARQCVGSISGEGDPNDGSPDSLNDATRVQSVNYPLSIGGTDGAQVEDLQFIIVGSSSSFNCNLSIGGNNPKDKWIVGMK